MKKLQKSYYAKPEDVKNDWKIIDAKGQVLGRLASHVAKIVTGKNKVTYTPAVDTGDFVVIINADDVLLTGKKADQKIYYSYSGYPGGLKSTTFKQQKKKDSSEIIKSAIKGMLPNNRLGRKLLTKVKIYKDAAHPHEAQKPQNVELA